MRTISLHFTTQMLLTHDEQTCFCGSQSGALYMIDLSIPLHASVIAGGEGDDTVTIQSAHTRGITSMTLTGDDKHLLTGAKDGTVFVGLQRIHHG